MITGIEQINRFNLVFSKWVSGHQAKVSTMPRCRAVSEAVVTDKILSDVDVVSSEPVELLLLLCCWLACQAC